MNNVISDWEKFYEEATGYHKTVRGSIKRPKVFTPVIISNLAAMSIEKYFMAIFMHRGTLPQNHTMADFLEEIKKLTTIDQELEEILRYMDSIQMICSFFDIKTTEPQPEDVPRFLKAVDAVARLAEEELGAAVKKV